MPQGPQQRGGRGAGRPRPSGGAGQQRRGTSQRSGRPRTDTPRQDRRPAGDAPAVPRPDEPALPDDVTAADLDQDVRRDLRGLSRIVADRVARHLVMAGRLVDDEPETALAHARAARRIAGRVAVVREAAGIAAYLSEAWPEALSELRAARRMGGAQSLLHVIADCERALGRPERALELAGSVTASELPAEARVELAIVVSGARRDLGQLDAAVLALQGPDLDSTAVEDWTLRLWYAYADALQHAGRVTDAARWFTAVVEVDEEESTDAAERLEQL